MRRLGLRSCVLTPVFERVVEKHAPDLQPFNQPELVVLWCCGRIVERLRPLDDREEVKHPVPALGELIVSDRCPSRRLSSVAHSTLASPITLPSLSILCARSIRVLAGAADCNRSRCAITLDESAMLPGSAWLSWLDVFSVLVLTRDEHQRLVLARGRRQQPDCMCQRRGRQAERGQRQLGRGTHCAMRQWDGRRRVLLVS